MSLYCLYIAFYSFVFLSFYISACVTNKSHYNCDYSTAQHYGFVPNLVLNPAVKEFRKSVNIWNSYCLTKNSSRFFETQCINKWKRFVCPFWAFDEQWIQFNERSKLVTVNSSRAKKQDGELVTDAKKMTVNLSQKIPCDEFTVWRIHWLPSIYWRLRAGSRRVT